MSIALSTNNRASKGTCRTSRRHGISGDIFCSDIYDRSETVRTGGPSSYCLVAPHQWCLLFRFVTVAGALCALVWLPSISKADWPGDSPPAWERLLWGGYKPIGGERSGHEAPSLGSQDGGHIEQSDASRNVADEASMSTPGPEFACPPAGPVVPKPICEMPSDYQRVPFRVLTLKNIPPLYRSPVLPGEGVWESTDMPKGDNGWPVLYRTSYRPSFEYPNAIVHMLLFDMKRLSMTLYLGSAEPGGSKETSRIEPENEARLVAITNALWKQRHSGDAGSIYRGRVIKELAPGMATLVIYKDGSIDILEWNTSIPESLVQDAKQLKHLIVKDGKVVNTIVTGGQRSDAEIGLGYLLVEEPPMNMAGMWGNYWGGGPVHTSGSEWFIATRSAFGIRKDGNLVFALGHHISTKDLAKALALAGCRRAIHGDANPFNVLGNLYYRDDAGNLSRKTKLSPDQNNHTLSRYVDRHYTSDFFGFFLKHVGRESS